MLEPDAAGAWRKPVNTLGRLRRRDTQSDADTPQRTAADCRKERAGVLTVYGWCLRGGVIIFVLALLFTMVNVQIFAASGHQPGSDLNSSFHWFIAWFLDPMASLALVVAVILGGVLARYGETSGWLTTVKWFSGLGTWAMNIWPAIDNPHPSGTAAGILLHSIAPGLVLLGAEAIPWVRLQMTRIADTLEREAQAIEAVEAAERKTIADREAAERQAEIDARHEETRRTREAHAEDQKRLADERAAARRRADEIALAQAHREAAEAQAAADRERAEADRAETDKLAQKAAVRPARGPRSKTGRTGGADRRGKADRTGRSATPPDVTDLLPAGRAVAARAVAEGRSLTRTALLTGLRSDDVPCSTDRASALLDLLNAERSERRSEQDRTADRDRSDRPVRLVAGGGH